jgi:hypothetical protein
MACVHERNTRPSYRRLSAELVPTFADRECHVVSLTEPSPQFTHKAEWAQFQTH